MITEGIEKKQRGTITSIYSSMRFIGVALGPPVVSLLMKSSRYSVFLTLASFSALGAVLALMVIRPKKSHAQKKSLFQKLG
jgi:ACDE family multidrug resistance protein